MGSYNVNIITQIQIVYHVSIKFIIVVYLNRRRIRMLHRFLAQSGSMRHDECHTVDSIPENCAWNLRKQDDRKIRVEMFLQRCFINHRVNKLLFAIDLTQLCNYRRWPKNNPQNWLTWFIMAINNENYYVMLLHLHG